MMMHIYKSNHGLVFRELRHKKLVDDTLARHGLKRKALNAHRMERLREAAEGEAEELLDAQVRLSVIQPVATLLRSVVGTANRCCLLFADRESSAKACIMLKAHDG
jgi:hypothetical protein